MADIGSEDILFIGKGSSSPAWYRCVLPALTIKADWINIAGDGVKSVLSGMIKGEAMLAVPHTDEYKVIVVQQAWGTTWHQWIRKQQGKGIKVLYELDDNIHSVAKMKSHPNHRTFRKLIKEYELCMTVCDGMIVSTEPLAKRYRKFNKRIWICEQGIDFDRYQVNRRSNTDKRVTIGWSGGIGQEESFREWDNPLWEYIRDTDSVRFMSVGLDYASFLQGVSVPYTQIEQYPSVLSNFDVALAPARNNAYYKGKSQLRWMEASAVGIPVIASPEPYKAIRPGHTGVIARDAKEFKEALRWLCESPRARQEIGQAAKEQVEKEFHIFDKILQWTNCFEEVYTD